MSPEWLNSKGLLYKIERERSVLGVALICSKLALVLFCLGPWHCNNICNLQHTTVRSMQISQLGMTPGVNLCQHCKYRMT